MVFFYNAEGDLLSLTPEQTYQGSNKANTIYFVCPTAPTNAVSVAFKLPNGEFTTPYLMQLAKDTGIEQVVDSNGNKYYLWYFELPIAVTSYKGNVTIQFFITTPESTIATQSAVFMVSKGVTYIEPEQGNTYQEVLSQLVALQSQLDGKQDTLTAGENITIVDNVISSTGGGGSVTVDAELSTVSTNPVQNKVVTEALGGKLDKFEPQYNNTTVVWAVQKRGDSSTRAFIKEISGIIKADVIPITGTGGTLRVGNPTDGQHAVPYSYLGHRYKFTSNNALDMFFGGGELVFYHDTKSQFDLDTLVQEILGKAIPFVFSFEPSTDGGCVGNGSFYTASVVKNADNTLTIGFTKGNIHYWVSANTAGNGVIMDGGNTKFTVEQIY